MRSCAACKQSIDGAAIRICGGYYCSMECVKQETGHERRVFKEASSCPRIGGEFASYQDPIMGVKITSWRQQERELKRFNADPRNKEKRSFFQDNHRAVLEARNFQRHKRDIATATYAKEGIKLKEHRGSCEKGRTVYSIGR